MFIEWLYMGDKLQRALPGAFLTFEGDTDDTEFELISSGPFTQDSQHLIIRVSGDGTARVLCLNAYRFRVCKKRNLSTLDTTARALKCEKLV